MQMIFVFGSNLAGRHGKGAALFAAQHCGAERGIGVGRTGQAYAIPTKDKNLRPLSLETVSGYIYDFAVYARAHPELTFLLTPVGTGLAGFSKRDIWAAVKAAKITPNVVLASSWLD